MKIANRLAILGVGLAFMATQMNLPVRAVEDSAADFFRNDREYWSKGQKAPPVPDYSWTGSLAPASSQRPAPTTYVRPERAHVAQRVKDHAAAQLGSQWVPTALSIARLESGFNCRATGPKTRHGRAKGVFQVMPASARALGYDYGSLHDCEYGIAAGIAHMRSCINAGVRTHNDMARCHVAGVKGWNVRLNRNAERYKRQYVRMAMRM